MAEFDKWDDGAQAALAVGVGYALGRRRKMRLATMLAIGAATGGVGRFGPIAMRRGAKYLGSTDLVGALGPEVGGQVGDIVSTIRGELLDATKAAAIAAVSSRIESVSDSLHDRAETLRNPEAAVADVGDEVGDTVGRVGETVAGGGESVGRLRRRRPVRDEEDAGPERGEEQADENGGQSSRGRGQARRAARPEPDEADEADKADEPLDEYEDEEPYEDEAEGAPADEADDLAEDEDLNLDLGPLGPLLSYD